MCRVFVDGLTGLQAVWAIAYGIFDSSRLLQCFLPSSELSHSILAIAISHVSRTARSGSAKYRRKIGTESRDEMAPRASAAYLIFIVVTKTLVCHGERHTSCRTIGSSEESSKTDSRVGRAAKSFICPRQYANSCFRRAEGSANPV